MSRNPITRSLILGLVIVGIALVPVLAQAAPRHQVAAGESWNLADAFHRIWTAICGGEGTGADPNKTTKLTLPPTPSGGVAAPARRADAGGRSSAFSIRAEGPAAGRHR